MVAYRLKNGCYRKQIHALPLKFNSQSMSDQASRQYCKTAKFRLTVYGRTVCAMRFK